tara:strand:- start:146 stop:523 length:378 start_codon:yes stop_codon:yes gene_type:complete
MAHFAELNSDNIVQRVIVVGNADCLDSDGEESEAIGIAFCQGIFGSDTIWKQTSYNRNMRGIFAGRGCTYDASVDKFFSPRPFSSWILDRATGKWNAPVAQPSNENYTRTWKWVEASRSWVEVTE